MELTGKISMNADGKQVPGFFKSTLSPGMIMRILAQMGAGKSNYASVLIENASKLDYDIFTNMFFYEDKKRIQEAIEFGILEEDINYKPVPPNVHTVTTLSEALIKMGELRMKHKKDARFMLFLDESSMFASGDMALEKRGKWFKAFTRTIMRKLGGGMVLITQDSGSLLPLFRKDLPGAEIYIEVNRLTGERIENVYMIETVNGIELERNFVDKFRYIPRSTIPYDSKAPAKFEIDFDFDVFTNIAGTMKSLDFIRELPKLVAELAMDFRQENMQDQLKGVTKKKIIMSMLAHDPDIDLKVIRKVLREYFGEDVSATHLREVYKQFFIK
jgi:hypothetical protein